MENLLKKILTVNKIVNFHKYMIFLKTHRVTIYYFCLTRYNYVLPDRKMFKFGLTIRN